MTIDSTRSGAPLMPPTTDAIQGSLVVIEPFVPEDQLNRRIVVLGWSAYGKGDGVVALCDPALGWSDWGSGSVVFLTPRLVDQSFETHQALVVDGVIWGDERREPLSFMAKVEIDRILERAGQTHARDE
jgi:hypothetical protein